VGKASVRDGVPEMSLNATGASGPGHGVARGEKKKNRRRKNRKMVKSAPAIQVRTHIRRARPGKRIERFVLRQERGPPVKKKQERGVIGTRGKSDYYLVPVTKLVRQAGADIWDEVGGRSIEP